LKDEEGDEISSEALAKPSSHLSKIAIRPCLELPRMPRFDVFEMGELRIDQETRGHRERCVLGLVGQAAETKRATDPDRTAEYLGGEIDKTGELRRTA
jgi:hypothetical protein